MWTDENRARYDRSKLRYPSDLTDEERALIGPLLPPAKRGGNTRTVVVRDVVDGLMYIQHDGCHHRQPEREKRGKRRGFGRSSRIRRGQEDQRQEAPHRRRYPGPAAALDRARRRHAGPRRRRPADEPDVRAVPVPAQAARRQRLQGPLFRDGIKRVCNQINVEIVKRCDVGKSSCCPGVGSSSGPSRGSTGAAGWPRTGSVLTVTGWLFCAGRPSD